MRGIFFDSRKEHQIFLFSIYSILTLGAKPASCPVGTGASFPGFKRPEREANYFSLVPKFRMRGDVHTSITPYYFIACIGTTFGVTLFSRKSEVKNGPFR